MMRVDTYVQELQQQFFKALIAAKHPYDPSVTKHLGPLQVAMREHEELRGNHDRS